MTVSGTLANLSSNVLGVFNGLVKGISDLVSNIFQIF